MELVCFPGEKLVDCEVIEVVRANGHLAAVRTETMRQPKEVVMRRLLLTSLIFGVITVCALPARLATLPASGKTIAVTEISEKTKLLKAELLGKYIFVHDDSKMA